MNPATGITGGKMGRLVQLTKENRYYIVETRKNLFGELAVVLRWGSLKTEWERQKEIPAKSQAHAEMLFENAVSGKLRRGYRRV